MKVSSDNLCISLTVGMPERGHDSLRKGFGLVLCTPVHGLRNRGQTT